MFWEKDGVEIDIKQNVNYIISSEGNLIIQQAKKTNTGNYTCGARNIAQERRSSWAILTVYGKNSIIIVGDPYSLW